MKDMPDRVRWIRSYVLKEPDGKLGTICIYEARDVESIKEHAKRVGMPGDEVLPVAATVVVREDPKGLAEDEQQGDDQNRQQHADRPIYGAAPRVLP